MAMDDRQGLCDLCLGSGKIAIGPWGVRPARKTCPECEGSGKKALRKIDVFAEKLRKVDDLGGIYVVVDPADTFDIDANKPATLYITIDGSCTIDEFERMIQEVYLDEKEKN